VIKQKFLTCFLLIVAVLSVGAAVCPYVTTFMRTVLDDATQHEARTTLGVTTYTWHYDLNGDLMPAWDIRGDETDYFEVNASDYSEMMPVSGAGVSCGWELDGNDDLQPVS
jgi:hypothetical protein